ncbi:hypothetical protein OsI_30730 [Oryza sativa Indica Group]|uniref:Uncharacterized protein n=1 Tax=Oryza sativa subsp. indica TaxID=39946 RepID=A2YZF4_ORYSI|nr:hypothetical protein OsI_30730 [Oryza sativa Indica Group]
MVSISTTLASSASAKTSSRTCYVATHRRPSGDEAGREEGASSSSLAPEEEDGTASARSANPQRVALELAFPCCAALARRPRRSGVRRGVVAPGRVEAGAPLVLALGLGVTVVPNAACRFAPPGCMLAACVDLQQKEYFKYQAKGEPDLGKLSALPIAACAGEIVPPNVQRAEAR